MDTSHSDLSVLQAANLELPGDLETKKGLCSAVRHGGLDWIRMLPALLWVVPQGGKNLMGKCDFQIIHCPLNKHTIYFVLMWAQPNLAEVNGKDPPDFPGSGCFCGFCFFH